VSLVSIYPAFFASAGHRLTGAIRRSLTTGRQESELLVAEGALPFVGVKVRSLQDSQATTSLPDHLARGWGGAPRSVCAHRPGHQPGGATPASGIAQELQLARKDFQTSLEELETANEELQATNEELTAAGEEVEPGASDFVTS